MLELNVIKKVILVSMAIFSIVIGNQIYAGTKLSQGEIDTLKFMREEEKLARDVYLTLYQQWGVNTFANIALSEQKHTDAIKQLLVKFGIDDPVKDDEIGVFVDHELAELYAQLIDQGMVSEIEALKVGALIEEVDMEDIVNAIEESDQRIIDRVYGNLLAGSENHLRAFVSQLVARGIDYEAQVLTQEEVDMILSR